jgi:hypothetical protein
VRSRTVSHVRVWCIVYVLSDFILGSFDNPSPTHGYISIAQNVLFSVKMIIEV